MIPMNGRIHNCSHFPKYKWYIAYTICQGKGLISTKLFSYKLID